MSQRNRFKQITSFEHRLADEAQRCKQQAEALPPGEDRDRFLRKARQAETASHISEWLKSSGLASPK